MMRGGRNITERDLEKEVKAIIGGAIKKAMFEPSDDMTLYNTRTDVARGLSALKHKGVIKGYSVDIQLEGTVIKGNITYTPLNVVHDIVIDLVEEERQSINFNRAMKGI